MIFCKRSIIKSLNCVRIQFIMGIAAMGLLMAGCAEVNYLRDAQSAFNEAARLENQLRSSDITTTEAKDLLLESEIRAGYASAIASIDKLDNRQIESLKSDKLWGVVLTIKAMSYWRLGAYDEMEDVAKQAEAVEDQIYPRDRALLMALPGLRRVDEAEAMVAAGIQAENPEKKKKIKEKRLEAVERLVQNASAILTRARQSVSETHPVRSYLIQAELAGYKNLMDGRDKFIGGGLNENEAEKVKQLLSELDCSFKKSLEDNEDLLAVRAGVVLAWQDRFGFLLEDFSCKD